MKSTKQLLALLVVALLFISCDKDYNTIGEGLVNETHFNQKVDSDSQIKNRTDIIALANGENSVFKIAQILNLNLQKVLNEIKILKFHKIIK